MSTGGGFKGIWPRVNLLALNSFSSSGVRLPSGENRLSGAAPPGLAPAAGGAAAAPNPPLICPKALPLPAAADVAVPKPLPNPPPVFAVEEKLNPEAEPNPEAAAGLSAVGAAKENVEADGAEEEPNPEVGCVGAAMALPNPAEDAGAAEEANPPPAAAKPKVAACTGAPKPTSSEISKKKLQRRQWYASFMTCIL